MNRQLFAFRCVYVKDYLFCVIAEKESLAWEMLDNYLKNHPVRPQKEDWFLDSIAAYYGENLYGIHLL